MGTWRIEVTGTGMHHNGKPEDADAQAMALVAGLRAAGSTVRHAFFTLTSIGDDGERGQDGGSTDLIAESPPK